MEMKIKYFVVSKISFKAEGRVFKEKEKYSVYDKNGRSLLVMENGEFLFTNELMEKVIEEWQLEVINN